MEKNPEVIAREIRTTPTLDDADILFLQEVVRDGDSTVADEVSVRLKRFVAFASPDGRNTFGGLAILSRYPLQDLRIHPLKPQNLVFRSRKRIALAATVVTPDGPVRLVNAHLDTRINPAERLAQLGAALDDASCFFGPTVIGGDFNTNDMQWVSNVVPIPFPGWQASRVRILMESRGFRTPFQTRRATFDHMGMQLDWIYTNGLIAIAHGIQPIEFSDHHAIWVRLGVPSAETQRARAPQVGGH